MKAFTRFSAAFASSLPMASANCVCGRTDRREAAPPVVVCRRVSMKKPANTVAISSSGESAPPSASSRCCAFVRGSTSTPTSAKPPVALRSASLSIAVPAQPSTEQPGTVALAFPPSFSVYSTSPGWLVARPTTASLPASAAFRKSETLRWFSSHASGAFSNFSASGLLRASASTAT